MLADDADAGLDCFERRGAADAAEVDDEAVLLDAIPRRPLTRRPESDGVVEAVAQEHHALFHGARPAPTTIPPVDSDLVSLESVKIELVGDGTPCTGHLQAVVN